MFPEGTEEKIIDIEPLQVFDGSTYGYDHVTSQSVRKDWFNTRQSEIQQILEQADFQEHSLSEQSEYLAQELSEDRFAQRLPLFVGMPTNLVHLSEGNLDPTRIPISPLINPLVKPWIYEMQPSLFNAGVVRTNGGESLTEAEALTDNDSSWYGLVASAVSETKARRNLFALGAVTFCKAYQRLDLTEASVRVSEVFGGLPA